MKANTVSTSIIALKYIQPNNFLWKPVENNFLKLCI